MTRNPTRTIQTTWLAMLALQTVGAIDGQHKLPAPRQYVAISVLWGAFFLLADTGLSRLVARLSVLMLVTASVIGPFGKKLVDFLDTVSQNFSISPAPTPTPGTAPPQGRTRGGAFTPAPAPTIEPGQAAQVI